jgi:carboxyl-terminal processing protease
MRSTYRLKRLGCILLASIIAGEFIASFAQQPPSKFEIERARLMLDVLKDDVKKNYYDPTYHGVDIEARFKASDDKLKQAASIGQLWGIIAQTLVDLNDSHTFFLPPQKRAKTDYGWQMQMVGDHCYVNAIKPGSDAEAKGLTPGDEIISLDGRTPGRDNLWLIQYLYYALRPQPGMRLVLKTPAGLEKRLDVLARVKDGKQVTDVTGSGIWDLIREAETEDRLHRHRYVEYDNLLIWKMPQFDLTREKVDTVIDKAKKHKNLLLDLRGNGGGYEETLLRFIGNLFDHDITVGDLKRRKETKPMIAKTRGGGFFTGKLVVLIDSRSGSAAELLARVVQVEKRGAVIGDRTSGAVMRARDYEHQVGQDIVVFYGVSVTDADIIMADGKSLERIGVTPDETRLPTAADLAAKRDPVLAYAASLLGTTITPEQAGALFPLEWRK